MDRQEAIKVVRDNWPEGRVLLKSALEILIPELQESEDERIRKSLIKYIKGIKSWNYFLGISREQMLTWLEKQTIDISSFPEEQRKYMEKYINLDKITLIKLLAEKDENVSEILDCENNEIKKIEQKASIDFSNLKTWKYIIDAVLTKEHGIGQYLDNGRIEIMAKELQERFGNIMQKPVWSEEDKKILETLINDTEKTLFAIKQEERDDIMSGLSEIYIERLRWLKSLKERYAWKPSKEQIIALRWVLNNVPYNKHKEEISGLLDQIKNL